MYKQSQREKIQAAITYIENGKYVYSIPSSAPESVKKAVTAYHRARKGLYTHEESYIDIQNAALDALYKYYKQLTTQGK